MILVGWVGSGRRVYSAGLSGFFTGSSGCPPGLGGQVAADGGPQALVNSSCQACSLGQSRGRLSVLIVGRPLDVSMVEQRAGLACSAVRTGWVGVVLG